jgi:hypothetical protein
MYPQVTQFDTRTRHQLEMLHSLGLEPSTRPRARKRSALRNSKPNDVGRRQQRPARYKLALLTWAGAYAVITLMLAVLGPELASWPLVLRTLAVSVVMVVSLTWLVMPGLTRVFRAWL